MRSNRQPELWAAALVPYSAAAAALVLRMVARHRTRKTLVWEDYLAIVAFVIGSGFTFLSVYKMRWGLGIPLDDINLPKNQIVYHYFLDLWADMWLYTFSVGLSKFVILGFYWRMFSISIIRQPIRVLFACSVGWIIVRVVLIVMQCQPIHKFWDKEVPGKCRLTPMMSLFGAGIPHFVIELAILLCPMIEIWRLQMAKARKVAVAAMFMSGLLVCGSALGTIIHTVALDRRTDTDLTWDGIDDQIWAVCDVNLASFATSLPLLRPVFRSFGGIFSGLKSDNAPSQVIEAPATATVGSEPSRRRKHSKGFETDSVIEFADEGGLMDDYTTAESSKGYVMQDLDFTESRSRANDSRDVSFNRV